MEHRSTKSEHLSSDKIERVYSRSAKGNLTAEAIAPVAIVHDQLHFGFYVGQTTSYPISLSIGKFTEDILQGRRLLWFTLDIPPVNSVGFLVEHR